MTHHLMCGCVGGGEGVCVEVWGKVRMEVEGEGVGVGGGVGRVVENCREEGSVEVWRWS